MEGDISSIKQEILISSITTVQPEQQQQQHQQLPQLPPPPQPPPPPPPSSLQLQEPSQQQPKQHQQPQEPQSQLNDASTPNKMIKKEKKRRKKKKRPPHKSKMVTGYIIYASEIRKDIIKKYPNRDFGDISKIVGVEWKNLPQETKIAFEKRAQEQNAKSKIAAAEALALKKLADAAEERAKEQELLAKQQLLPSIMNTNSNDNSNSCNGVYQRVQLIQNTPDDWSSSPLSPNITHSSDIQQMQLQRQQTPQIISKTAIHHNQQQQPFQIIQQQQQPIGTTVQYCNSNNYNNNSYSPQIQIQINPQNQQQTSLNSPYPSQTPQLTPIQYQRNNIVYRKPATVRLRPKDAITQTDPIVWLKQQPKKPLRFSQKFIDYLKNKNSSLSTISQDLQQLQEQQPNYQAPPPLINGTNSLSSPETNDSAYSSIQ